MDDNQVEYPIDGVLDLHAFHPREVKEVVLAYIEACQERGILDIRIIHGKGIGVLREQVHQLLKKHDAVKSFSLATDASSWGATVVRLASKRSNEEDQG